MLVADTDSDIAAGVTDNIAASVADLDAIRSAVANGMAYDMMLGADNPDGNALVLKAVDALVTQTRSIERAVSALQLSDLKLEWSDSLDAPTAVFQ